MRRPELPIVSFLTIFLLLCSLPSHVRAGSVAIVSLVTWLGVVSFIRGINAIVWANNFSVQWVVWCDITTKITVGFTYAVPAATLCVLRHLERVASTRHVSTTARDKRHRQYFEATMCFGLPLIGMTLHYIVQGHRLDIIEDFGCYPPVYFSVAAIMILWVPPFTMSLITFVYAAITLRHFLQRRIEFAAHLRNSQSAITPSRYLRLMAMSVVEMVWDSGVNAYLIYFNSFTGLRPWTNWDDVHSNFSRIALFPERFIPPVFVTQLIWQWWIVPISCFLFFIFFAFGEEAMTDYRNTFRWLRRTVLRQKISQRQAPSNRSILPTYQHQSPSSIPMTNMTSTKEKPWEALLISVPEGYVLSEGKPTIEAGESLAHTIVISKDELGSSRSTSPDMSGIIPTPSDVPDVTHPSFEPIPSPTSMYDSCPSAHDLQCPTSHAAHLRTLSVRHSISTDLDIRLPEPHSADTQNSLGSAESTAARFHTDPQSTESDSQFESELPRAI